MNPQTFAIAGDGLGTRPWWISAVVGEPRIASALWSDDALVRVAASGSSEAFSRLVERHQQALRAFLRRACGNWAMADDLAQDTFLMAWERLDRLRSGSSVRAWLCGIGYRKYLTRLRGDIRMRRREADYSDLPATSVQPGQEDRMALEQAMNALPAEQRACVALCLAADFSHGEAAEALKLPLGTVKSHVQRGRQRLLEALGAPDDQP